MKSNAILQAEILPYSKEYQNSFINLYRQVFNHPPWNENWSQPDVKKIEANLFNKKGFKGYVLRIDQKAVAFLFAHPINLFFSLIQIYYLSEIFVDQNYRGLGLGKKLLLHFFKDAHQSGGQKIFLHTMNNSPAHLFYQNLGFKNFFPWVKKQSTLLMYKKIIL